MLTQNNRHPSTFPPLSAAEPAGPFEGAGSEDDPFQIWDVADLQKLDELVDAGNADYNTAYYKQMDNIDMTGVEWTGIGSTGTLYLEEPAKSGIIIVNYNTKPFKGVYDGNGKTISNLSPTIPNDTYAGGLMNSAMDATIKNLTIDFDEVKGGATKKFGGFVGNGADLVFSNCVATGTITCNHSTGAFVGMGQHVDAPHQISFYDCVNEAAVTGKKTGGFFGAPQGQIVHFVRCVNKGEITTTGGSDIGGFTGYNGGNATYEDCSNEGIVNNGFQFAGAAPTSFAGTMTARDDRLVINGALDGANFADKAAIVDHVATLISNDQVVVGGEYLVMSKIGTLPITLDTVDQTIAFDVSLNSAFAATITADGVAVTTNLAENVLTYTAIEIPAPTPTWPEDWPKDVDPTVQAKFDTWATTYGVTSFEGNEDAFLMNVDPEGTVPELKITSITVADDVATIVVDAGDADLATVNGVLFLDKSNDLKAWTTHQIPLDGEIKDGNWTVTVEGAKFMKAEVGFKAPAAE